MEIFDEEIERILNNVIELFLIPKFLELDMRATGQWEANIHARGNEIWGRDYTEYLVNGRPPGGMPPVQAIFRWSYFKFGNQDIGTAWAIAKGIEKNGTSWYQKGGSDLLEVLESEEVQRYIADELGVWFTHEVELQITRQLRELETV